MNRELKMRNTPKILVALLAALLLFAAPAQVFAAAGDPTSDPTASQYDDPGSTVTQESDEPSEEVTLISTGGSDDNSSGSLPFTGFDAGVLAIIALLLGATGLALRRLSAVK
jgi:hypothetical protein